MKDSPKSSDPARRAWEVVQEATSKAEGQNALPPGLEALRINQVLLSRGLTQIQANLWWYASDVHLEGRTPTEVWLSEETPSSATVEAVRNAAKASGPS